MPRTTSKKQPAETKPKPQAKRNYRTHQFSAQEKCEAVLAVWTERRRPSAICRELEINWAQLNQWQDQALEGMLKALEGRRRLDERTALTDTLQKLFKKKGLRDKVVVDDKLRKRLEHVQNKEE